MSAASSLHAPRGKYGRRPRAFTVARVREFVPASACRPQPLSPPSAARVAPARDQSRRRAPRCTACGPRTRSLLSGHSTRSSHTNRAARMPTPAAVSRYASVDHGRFCRGALARRSRSRCHGASIVRARPSSVTSIPSRSGASL